MVNALDIVLLILAIASLLSALFFFIIALVARRRMSTNAYDVERQEKRQDSLVAFARSGFFLLLALILFSAFAFTSRPEQVARPTPTTAVDTVVPEETEPIVTVSSPAVPTSGLTPTSPVPTRTPLPTNTPIPTDTPVILTAIVASPNGLWLREAPGGTEQLELLPDGSILIVLQSRETIEDLEWQEVETEAGNIGWVAVDFIIYQ